MNVVVLNHADTDLHEGTITNCSVVRPQFMLSTWLLVI